MKGVVYGWLTIAYAIATCVQVGFVIYLIGAYSPAWATPDFIAAQVIVVLLLAIGFVHSVSELD